MKFINLVGASMLLLSSFVYASTDGVIVDDEIVWKTEYTSGDSGRIEKRCTSCVGNGGPCVPGKGQCHNPKGCWSKNGGPFVCQCAQGGEFNYNC